MVKLLDPTEIDPITEQVEEVMDAAEEAAARKQFAYTPNPGDLTDGGMVNGVKVRPRRDKTVTKGRPAARRAWMWNGTESVLPLAWNPEGTAHDGARHYLLKRHCLCCHTGGFTGRQCKKCVKDNCDRCKASTDTTTVQNLNNGKQVRGWIVPAFYLRKEDVPFQARFYGSIDCFLEFCPRRGGKGFLTEQSMRIHAETRHKMEYKAHMDTLAASKSDQVEVLQKRIDDLMLAQAQINARQLSPTEALDAYANPAISNKGVVEIALAREGLSPGPTTAVQVAPQQTPARTPAQDRMAKARAARKQNKAAVGVA